jgi:hypothetical protein
MIRNAMPGRGGEDEISGVAAECERRKEDQWKELDADRQGEKSSGEEALIVLEENEHAQDDYRGEDANLSPGEIMQERERG